MITEKVHPGYQFLIVNECKPKEITVRGIVLDIREEPHHVQPRPQSRHASSGDHREPRQKLDPQNLNNEPTKLMNQGSLVNSRTTPPSRNNLRDESRPSVAFQVHARVVLLHPLKAG